MKVNTQESKESHNRSIIQVGITILTVLCFFVLINCVDQLKPSKKDLEEQARKEVALVKSSTYYQVPSCIKEEHEDLLNSITTATNIKGETGTKAGEILELVKHHFTSEESFALPPLGLLPLLEKGQEEFEIKKIQALTNKLQAELPHLLVEHLQISEQLDQLRIIAIKEKQNSLLMLIDKIKQHAQLEEQVLFPTVILIGDYLELKYPQKTTIAKPALN